MEKKIYSVYSQEADMTFIMEEEGNTLSVKGFYFGEPSDSGTEEYYNKLSCETE